MNSYFKKYTISSVILRISVLVLIIGAFASCYCTNYCQLFSIRSGNKSGWGACRDICENGPVAPLDTTASKRQRNLFPGETFSNVFTVGPTFSFMNTGSEMNYEGTKKQAGIGVQAGFGTSIPFSSTFSVAPTIRFNQMVASETTSYSSTGGDPSSEYKNTSTYNYIGGNMLAQYRPANHLSIVAGPEISYLVSASAKQSGSSDSGDKESLTKNSNRVGFGLLGGIKYEIPAGNKRPTWGVSLMYDYMLTSVNKKQDNGYDVPSAKIGGVQLGVSYFWKRSKK